jgi:thiaminase/transcriptional activator TenA
MENSKLSGLLFLRAKELWVEASNKDFVISMAKGDLSRERFCNYMIQDYLYLLEYTKILEQLLKYAEDEKLRSFIDSVIKEVEYETDRVHIPGMKKAGISEKDIENSRMDQVLAEYVGFMRSIPAERGLLAGLTALLQCSWVYAYIGKSVTEQYPDEVADSPYKDWFEAYTSDSYVSSNQLWIDTLDRESAGIDEAVTESMCSIFVTCAEYENRFWDRL